MKSTLCCLLTPLSQPLWESLGFSLRFCSPTTSTGLRKLYSRCAVPASSCCCFHTHGMEHFSKRNSHKGQLNRRTEKAQNSSFFLLSCHFFNATGQESNCKSALLPGPKSSGFLLLTLLGMNINLITSQLVSHFISLCLVHQIRESPFNKLLFAALSNPQQPLPGQIRISCRRNRLWQKQFHSQTLQTLLFSTPTHMPLFVFRGAQRISARLTLEIEGVVERPIIVEFVTKARAEGCRTTHQDCQGMENAASARQL